MNTVMMTSDTLDITGSVESLLGVGTQVMNFITGNEFLFTLFCASLVGVGCYVIRKVKKTAKA